MTEPQAITFVATDLEALTEVAGKVAVLLPSDGRLDRDLRRIDRLTRGALARLAESPRLAEMDPGAVVEIGWPAGLKAEALLVAKLDRRAAPLAARKAGAALAAAAGAGDLTLLAGPVEASADLALGAALRR